MSKKNDTATYRGGVSVKILNICEPMGFTSVSIKKHQNWDYLEAGCDLGYLNEDDIRFMLNPNTSEVQAQQRLIQKRGLY